MNADSLRSAWCRETAHPSYQDKWSEDNPSYGQCAVTALLVNDLCFAPIYKCKVGRATHYYNMFARNFDVIDFTSEQFGNRKIDYFKGEPVSRDQLLKCKHVREWYELLKQRFVEDCAA